MDFTPIFQALISLLAALITGFLLPWIRSRLTASQTVCVNTVVALAVQAAEQLFAGEGRGEERKEYVLAVLAAKGYRIDDAAVDAAIEAAVYRMKQGLLN